MSILNDFLDKLPANNRIPVKSMFEILSEDDLGFIIQSLIVNKPVPTNIINRIDEAFRIIGYPGFTWDTCRSDFGFKGTFDFN